MNTQQLQCFLCVADKLNFTRAAEELYLTTPTVTHHIQSLENELNTKLFFRNNKTVRLTGAGQIFYQDAKDIADKLSLAGKHLKAVEERQSSILKIGCSSHGELPRLTGVLKEFHREFPGVYPKIVITDYFQMANMLNDRQLDIILAAKEMMKGFSDYSFLPIRKMETFALVLRDDSAATKKTVSFHDLEASNIISLHPKMVPFRYGSNVQKQIRLHAQTHLDLMPESSQVCITLAASGYGAAILPDFTIPEGIDDFSLVKLRLEERDVFEYGAAYQRRNKNMSVKRFLQILQAGVSG